jgi:5-methylcytosine-specific restriction endonuclease McrA
MTDKPIIMRSEAKALGLTRYFTGKPCLRGHIAERQVIAKRCLACQSTPTKPGGKRYFTGKPCVNGHIAERTIAQRNCVACATEKKRKAREGNPEIRRQKEADYRARNPNYARVAKARRSARKRAAAGRLTAPDIASLFDIQKGKCANPSCRVKLTKKYEADHVVPLVLGGANNRKNIQLLCRPCNRNKAAKHPIVWALQCGRLV